VLIILCPGFTGFKLDAKDYILVLGLSHKTAPIELREKLALPGESIVKLLGMLTGNNSIKEAMIISTCNRVELYSIANGIGEAIAHGKESIAKIHNLSTIDFELYLYSLSGLDAVRHIFRVTSSLDSMVVGEPQILGQIKEAFRTAIVARAVGPIINRLMHRAFHTAKRVRTETGIGRSAVSIGYAAVELAKKIFGDLKGKKVMAMGTGEMGELVLRHLISNNVGEIFITNRTYSRAETLAKSINAKVVKFEDYPSILHTADIVICSTGSPHYIIRAETMGEMMRKRNNLPMFFIDISVPRNIDPALNDLENIYLYDIDDLEEVTWGNIKEREKDAAKAEDIVSEEVNTFALGLEELKIVPFVVDLKSRIAELAERELKEAMSKMKNLDDTQKGILKEMADAIVNKLLHNPIASLKKMQRNGEIYIYLDAIKDIFGLKKGREDEENKNRNESE